MLISVDLAGKTFYERLIFHHLFHSFFTVEGFIISIDIKTVFLRGLCWELYLTGHVLYIFNAFGFSASITNARGALTECS